MGNKCCVRYTPFLWVLTFLLRSRCDVIFSRVLEKQLLGCPESSHAINTPHWLFARDFVQRETRHGNTTRYTRRREEMGEREMHQLNC